MAATYAGDLIYSFAQDESGETSTTEELSTVEVSETILNLSDPDLQNYITNFVQPIESPFTENVDSVETLAVSLQPSQMPSEDSATRPDRERPEEPDGEIDPNDPTDDGSTSGGQDDGGGGFNWYLFVVFLVSALCCLAGIKLGYSLSPFGTEDDEMEKDDKMGKNEEEVPKKDDGVSTSGNDEEQNRDGGDGDGSSYDAGVEDYSYEAEY